MFLLESRRQDFILPTSGLTGGDGGTAYISVPLTMSRSGLAYCPYGNGSLPLVFELISEDGGRAVVSPYNVVPLGGPGSVVMASTSMAVCSLSPLASIGFFSDLSFCLYFLLRNCCWFSRKNSCFTNRFILDMSYQPNMQTPTCNNLAVTGRDNTWMCNLLTGHDHLSTGIHCTWTKTCHRAKT
jgi:hypothetical protein